MKLYAKVTSVAASLSLLWSPIAMSGDLPTGAQVTHGQVGIHVDGTQMQINQASQQAIVNWESFSIGAGYGVNVNQPSAGAAMLSRVIGMDQSRILGALRANGIFYLVNRNGVFFGPDATVDVGALIASVLDISDADFLAARKVFQGESTATIDNNGAISAEKFALLVARAVRNNGSVRAPQIFAGAAQTAVVDTVAGGKIKVNFARLLGDVHNRGKLDASGPAGGSIVVKGARVAQLGAATADGTEAAGGRIELRAEQVVDLGKDSVTTANAGAEGDGGEVTVFSPDTALFRRGAVIEANASASGGDGGAIEVSGQAHVEVNGAVSASAGPGGAAGSFLIDPTDITIISGADDLPADLAVNPQTFSPDQDANTLQASKINTWLKDGLSVTVDTTSAHAGTGDVVQNADAGIAPPAGVVPVTLTVNARGKIELNGGIDASGLGQALTVELLAADPTQTPVAGAGLVDINAAINTNGGSLTVDGDDFDNSDTITTGDGPIDLDLSNNVTFGAAVTTNLLIQVEADGSIAVNDNITSQNSNIILDAGNDAGDTVTSAANAIISAPNGTVDVDAEDVNLYRINASGQVPGSTFGIEVTADNDVTVSGAWVTDTTDNVNQQGDIEITAGNELFVSAALTAEDNVEITVTADDINLDAAVTAGETIDMIAGDDILNSAGNALAAQSGNVELDAGNAQPVADVRLRSAVTAGGDILIGQTVADRDVNTEAAAALTADDNVRITGRNVNIAASITSDNDGGEDDVVIAATAPIAQTAGTIDANSGSVSIISDGTSGIGGTVSLIDVDAAGDNQVVAQSDSGVAALQFVSIQVRGLGQVTAGGIDATGTALDPNTETSNVEVISDNDNVLLGDVDAVNTVFLQAKSGSVTDNNADTMNVVATKIDARAQDLIGDTADNVLANPGSVGFNALETTASQIAAVTTAAGADIALDNTGTVTVSDFTPSTGQQASLWVRSSGGITVASLDGLATAAENDSVAFIASSGNVVLPDSGNAATTGAADIETTGDVRLEAAAATGQVTDGGATFAVIADDFLLKSGGAQTVRTAVGNLDATITGAGNGLTIQENAAGAALTLTDLDGDSSSVATNGGNITITVNSAADNLTVDGAATPGTDPDFMVDAKGANVALTVVDGGAGGILIEDGATVTTDSTDVSVFGDLAISGRVVLDGAVSATNGRTLTLAGPAAAMTINPAAFAAAGAVTLDGSGAGVTIPVGAEFRVAAGGGKAGDVTIQNSSQVTLGTPVAVDGSFTVTGVTGSVTLDDVEFDANRDGTGALSITTSDGAATFLGDVTLNGTIDGNGQTATFTVDGAVTAGADGLITDVGSLTVTAAENIGTAASPVDIGTTVIDVETQQASMDIFLGNTPPGDVTAFEATTAGGSVTYSQAGHGLAVTGNGVTTAGGALSIDPPGDVTVNANINLGAGRYQQTNTGSYTVAAGISITAGDVDIVADSDHDGLAGDGVSAAGFVQTDGAGQVVSTSNVAIEAANIETNDIRATTAITLRATGNGAALGTISENGGAVAGAELQAQTVNLISGGAINADLDATVALNVTGGADVNVEDTAGGLPVGSISANAGAGNVTLVSAAGVSDAAADVEADVTASDLNVTAAGAVDLDTDVATLTVDASTGDITIQETDGIQLSSVDTDAGSVGVTAAGAIEIDTVAASGTATLSALAAAITDADGNSDVDGTTVGLVAGNGNIGAVGLPITVDATTMVNADASQNDGSIWLTNSAGAFLAGSIDAGAGNISAVAQAGFTDANGALTNLHGADANIAAGGAFDADTDLDTITVSGATTANVDGVDGLTVTSIAATGQVDVTLATGGLVLTDNGVAAAAQTVNLTADWIDSQNANGTVEITGATVTMRANDGGIGAVNAVELTAATVVNADSSTAGGDVALTSIGAVDLPLGNVDAGSGNITLVAAANMLDANGVTANLTGSAVELTAVGTIGTAADGLETSIATLDVNAGATSVDIAETDDITLLDVDANGAVTVVAAAGSILVDALDAGAATVALTATGGAIAEADDDAAVDITGTTLTLTATGGGIGAANPLETNATAVVLAAAGPVGIAEDAAGTDLTVQGASGGGAVSVSTAAGSITLDGALNAGAGDVTLTATGGAITGGANVITADVLTADATAGQVDIDTNVRAADVTSNAAVTIDEASALEAIDIQGTAIDIETEDALAGTFDGTADITGSTSVTIEAAGTVAVETATPALNVTTDAAGDVLVDNATAGVTALALDATVQAGSLEVTTDDGLTVGDVGGAGLTTARLTATGGAITDGDAGAGNDITATTAELVAATGIGDGDPIETTIGTLSALSTGGGNVAVANSAGLTLAELTTNNGAIDISAAGAITDGAGLISGNQLTLDAAGAIGAAGTPLTTAVASIDAETSAAGAIVIDELDAVTLQDVDTADGDITVAAGGAVVIRTIDGGDDAVTLSSGGSITDNDDTLADITAGVLQMTAETGIGAVGDALDLVATSTGAATVAGVVNLANEPAAAAQLTGLSTGDASAITYTQNATTADQDLTITGVVVSGGGNVTVDPPANLAINADVGTIGDGVLVLESAVGGTITQGAGTSITTDRGDLTISGASGGSAGAFTMTDDSEVGATMGTITIIADGMTLDRVTTGGDVTLDADGGPGNVTTIPPKSPPGGPNGLITADHLQIRVQDNDSIDVATQVWKLSISGGSNISITQQGHLVIGDITAAQDGTVYLESVTEGITDDDDAGADVTIPGTGNLTLRAATVLDLDLSVANLDFAAGGDVLLEQVAGGGNLNLTAGASTAGDITLSTAAGSLVAVGNVTATAGDVTLTATGGSVSGAGDIGGRTVSVTATNGIDVDTIANAIVANAAAGDVMIEEQDDVTLTQINATGNIDVTVADGDIVVGAVTAAGTVDLSLNGAAGNDVSDDGDVATDLSGTVLTIDNAGAAVNGSVNVATEVTSADIQATGDVRITEADGLALTRVTGANVRAANGSNGDIEVTAVDAVGLASIDSDGAIDGGTITAPNVALEADTGVGATTPIGLDNAAGTTVAALSGANGITLDATAGNLTVGTVDGFAGVTAAGQTVDLSATAGNIDTAGDVKVTATLVDVDATGTVALNTAATNLEADFGGATAAINEDDAVQLQNSVGNALTLIVENAGDITDGGNNNMTDLVAETENGSITYVDADALDANRVVAGGAGSNVTITTGGAGLLNVGIIEAMDDTVTLNAGGAMAEDPAIVDAAGNETDIFGATLNLNAGANIGAAGAAIEIDASMVLNAASGGAAGNDIVLTDTIDDLQIGAVNAGAGDVILAADDSEGGGLAAAMLDAVDGGIDIVAANGTLTALTGIGGGRIGAATDVDVDLDTLQAAVTGVGDIHIEDVDGVTLTNVTTADGDVAIRAGLVAGAGDMLVGLIDADQFAENAVTLVAQDSILDHAADTVTDIRSGATTDLTAVQGRIGALDNPLEIIAGSQLNLQAGNAAQRFNFWTVGTGLAGGTRAATHVNYAGAGSTPPGLILWNGIIVGGPPDFIKALLEAMRLGTRYTELQGRIDVPSALMADTFFYHENALLNDYLDMPLIMFQNRGIGMVEGLPDGSDTIDIQQLIDTPFISQAWTPGRESEIE